MSDETEEGLQGHEIQFLHAVIGATISSIREERKNPKNMAFALFVFEEQETKGDVTGFGVSLVSSVEPTLVAEIMKDWAERAHEGTEIPRDA